MVKKVFGFLDRGVSWAEIIWKVIAFLIVLFGGSTTAILAKASKIFGEHSLFLYFLVGVAGSFVFIILIYFINLSRKEAAEIQYVTNLSLIKSEINPLADSFDNQIIRLTDLSLPLNKPHTRKLFKRCQIVGPGSVFINGGSYNFTNFIGCGDVIGVPEKVTLAGVVPLENCTFDQCLLINVTIITTIHPATIKGFQDLGMRVIIGDLK